LASIPAKAPALLSAERRRELHRRLVRRGSIRIAEEAQGFGTSEETIRRDIRALAAEGIAESVFGGAVLRTESGLQPGVPPMRERLQHEAKAAIGAAAARLVEPGQSVVLDAGTTTLAVARHLSRHRDLTFITNSLAVADVTAAALGSSTYVIGGKLVSESMSLVGPQAQRDLADLNADWAFIGAAAIDRNGSFSSADLYEAEVKRAMIRAAERVAIVADATKFGFRRFVSFAGPADIQWLLTTPGAPQAGLDDFAGSDVTVVICEPE